MIRDRTRIEAALAGRSRSRRDRNTTDRARMNPDEAMRILRSSVDRAEARRRAIPTIAYPEDLPVAARREEIMAAIAAHQVIVVCGETGSGKTTQLPKMCLELGRGVTGMIGHTQPRRIAARSCATRVAQELGSTVGGLVGFKVRFGDHTEDRTLIKVMTDGVLLAETQSDRRLDQYDTIIIDEAHERSLNIDFLLGYLRQLTRRRPDLKIIVTSATIDPERFAAHFGVNGGSVPIIEVSGRTYPVEVRYRPVEADDPDQLDLTMEEAVVHAVDELALTPEVGNGDILVFLPGEREIRETAELLRKHHMRGSVQTEILPLYARLSAAEQMQVFEGHRGRRIVLATNVAETSVTVPGIRGVVDTGLARIGRYSARGRMHRLPIEKISRASADQRKGRCGRIAPGVCIRLYDQSDFESREQHTTPEILRANLAAVILRMKALKLGDVADFPFMDKPEARLIHDGYETLHEIGAVDDDGELTELGWKLAKLPIDPGVGRMVLAAEREGCLAEVLVIAAGLTVQDPRERPMERREAADQAHAQWADPRSDFLALLNLWNWYHDRLRTLSRSKVRAACKQNMVSYIRMLEWADTHRQLVRIVTEMGHHPNTARAEDDAIHRSLLTGLLSNIGTIRDANPNGEYVGARGTRFSIFPGSALATTKPKWLMAAEIVQTSRVYARTVARIDPAWIERLAPHLIKRTHGEPFWDGASGRVMAHERITLLGLEIVRGRAVPFGPIDPVASRQVFIHHALVEGELNTRAPFAKHNAEVLEKIRAMEERGRRRDLLADTSARFAFFDRVIPAEVWSSQTFEKWRRDAERGDPRILMLSEEDVLAKPVEGIDAERYPDAYRLEDAVAPLAYAFAPGDARDGVTLRVPVELLGRLDERRPEWLVPGMVEEKVTALIKALPKQVRKQLGPAPELAKKIAPTLPQGSDRADFFGEVARGIGRVTGVTIDPAWWMHAPLPDHLRLRVEVVGDKGEVLAAGRDVAAIRRELGDRVVGAARTVRDDTIERTGCSTWNMGAIPETVDLTRDGAVLKGFPAIVDEGSTVGVRVFAEQWEAAQAMRRGVRRLAVRALGDAARHEVEQMPGAGALWLAAATWGDASRFRAEIVELVVDRACLGDGPIPRTPEAFEKALDAGWNRISDEVARVGAVAREIAARRQEVQVLVESAPPAWRETVDEIRAHLAALMPAGWILSTPWNWAMQLPRYLWAMRLRLERMRQGGQAAVARDREWAAQVAPADRAWRMRADDHRVRGIRDPELDAFRWMVEEFRVSIFAQELGTVVKVSPQRLEKQWQKVRV
jgi:ATP-dependent helicase HrpA